MFPPFVRRFLLSSLTGTPEALTDLVGVLGSSEPAWDYRPDPDRFTLREIVAHLADWEPINLERLTRIVREDEPLLPDIDEGALAADHGYSALDPRESLLRFVDGRVRLTAFLEMLPEDAWDRLGNRETPGRLRLADLVTVISLHDAYHIRQAARWLALQRA